MEERMTVRRVKSQFTCWINERERIRSFYYEEGFQQKKFTDKESYRLFILAVVEIYKVQQYIKGYNAAEKRWPMRRISSLLHGYLL